MLVLAIQPPAQARPGVTLYPPVAARLSSEANIFEELSQIWASATLVHASGEEVSMGGRVADSAHPLPENMHGGSSSNAPKDRAYFYFPDLVIYQPGQYRIKITRMQMDYSCDSSPDGAVIIRDEVESRSIVVESHGPSRSRPNATERAFMRVLRDDGQHV